MMSELTPDELNILVRLGIEYKRIIKEKAEHEAHYRQLFDEVEIDKETVHMNADEALIMSEHLDDYFNEIYRDIFDEVEYERKVAEQENRDRERYIRNHMPDVV